MSRFLAHTLCRLCELTVAFAAIWFAYTVGHWIGL